MKEGTVRRLGEVAEFTNGGAWNQTEYVESGVPVVRVSDISNGAINLEGCKYLPAKSLERYKKHILKKDDLIIATVGSHPTQPASVVGRAAKVPASAHGALLNQNAVVIRPSSDLLDKRYLYYLGCSSPFREYMISHARGSANQVRMSMGELKKMEIYLPSLLVQRKIGAILSAYDDLMESNLRRIKILEEMAQAIYNEWFVRFRFLGHEKVKTVDSPIGHIPEDWEVGTLSDALKVLESGSRPKGGVDLRGDVPSVGAENILGLGKYDFSKEKYVSRKFFENMRHGHVKSGDVLLYKDGAQIGRKTHFRDGFPHDECCINEHVFILRTNERVSQTYLYFWLDKPDMTQSIRNLNANAAQPGINQSSVRSLPILIPSSEVVDAFDKTVDPMLALLFRLAKENMVLHRTRDSLLPRLISGDVDVSKLDIDEGKEVA